MAEPGLSVNLNSSVQMPFGKAVVVEVICDRVSIDDDLLSENIDTNSAFVLNAPRNSILASPVTDNVATNILKLYIPFFSSHFSLPLKPGEKVWIIEGEDFGYWLSRVPSLDFVEDANYTHDDRINILKYHMKHIAKTTIPEGGSLEDQEIVVSPIYPFPTFPNGEDLTPSISPDFQPLNENSLSLHTVPFTLRAGYEGIVDTASEASRFITEPVPRFTKRPGDLVIQGSNNSTIVLGTDRGYNLDNRPEVSGSNAAQEAFIGSGVIDIVAGRGRYFNILTLESEDITDIEDIEDIDEDRKVKKKLHIPRIINNSRGELETDKSQAEDNIELLSGSLNLDFAEGDPCFITDAARVYVAMSTDVDKNFGLRLEHGIPKSIHDDDEDLPEGTKTLRDSGKAASVVTKADNIRIIARKSNIQKTSEVEYTSTPDFNGSIKIFKEGNATEDASSIYMLPDGDVQLSGKRIFFGRSRSDGQINSDYGSAGPGPGGSQPYVRFSDLQKLFVELFAALDKCAATMETAVSPGNGNKAVQVNQAGSDLKADLDAIKTAAGESFIKLASERIFGE